MPYINTAPSLLDAVIESISHHERNLGRRYYSEHGTDRVTAGQFTAEGGATVEVTALVSFAKKVRYGQDDERTVRVGASAKCHGWGCVEPSSEESFGEPVPLDAVVYDTAAAVEPHVQAARVWAQKHAETCRAQPYTGH
ncbi:hypothetical protein [Streptomyces sp. KN37]|uniref:hypothetical protein n=1 Tax=Streptomyces sp. KN37 TaxID=3090667 RepID=UPI002A750D30|nr:hypothetical protein [Streptomyces sp. KN37]WPO74005.1 hypothetical protein R9806_26995 [Streptomyces sp. KN37]